MEISPGVIKGVFYASAIFIAASMITKTWGSAPAQCKNMRRIQIVYYTVYFALIFPDLTFSVYLTPFVKLKGYGQKTISTIYICYQVSSIVGSLLCTSTLRMLGTRFTFAFCCVCKFISAILLVAFADPIHAYISRLVWGFSYMLTKITLDNWLVDLAQTYEISQADRGILLNYRMTFQFTIDIITTSYISKFVIAHGIYLTYTILNVYYAAIIVPLLFIMSFLTSPKKEEKKEEKVKEEKLEVPIEAMTTVLYDTVYVFSMGFFKSMLATNYIRQDLPFSVIMSTFNAMGTLGTILSTFLEMWFSDYTLHKVFIASYAIVFFFGWVFYDNDALQFLTTVLLGLLDGLITPVMVTLRKENIPVNIRVRALSSVRTFTSLTGFFVTFVMRYTNRQIYFLLITLLYIVCVTLPYYQRFVYRRFLNIVHIIQKIMSLQFLGLNKSQIKEKEE
ncbi:hypothetical protein TVAG_414160 [Trichomonas vaginalis G3]|uniref:Molybdate-anion transporter n=1 Tax=Trichomonas vaginalis (strain ATCC PRA-98 / G3) TaxID=412133 RepID=A2EC88_TRIV3|nr:SAM (S-adenosyl methionine) transporter family [Trichomonas vaginalis G3]EAY09765.1 hypothetical protein TVAG_414160 [Trichomonas vaginalis G3]KAI5550923.1 SAM (S-adenosyl methionine) transporter family [Trichomonas vaginalis G3]|eukprot:XP_001321988.1 hypothetical protein [Trichomonas vaginalis G3]